MTTVRELEKNIRGGFGNINNKVSERSENCLGHVKLHNMKWYLLTSNVAIDLHVLNRKKVKLKRIVIATVIVKLLKTCSWLSLTDSRQP